MADTAVGIRLSLKGKADTAKGLKETADGVKKIGAEAKSAEKKSESFLGSLIKFQIGYGIVNSVASGVKTLTTGMVGLGVKTASANQQAMISFTTLLGSATAANAKIAQMQKFAANTPFDFKDVELGTQRLIAMGIASKDTQHYLTAIGDAVAGLGGGKELLNQVVTAIGQMSAKGKIQSDEILQLAEAGIPALRILASEYGVSTAKMQAMITAGTVMSSKALPKLIDGLEHGTKSTAAFGGMMSKQSHTIAGQWSNLGDNVSQGLGKLVNPWIPMMTSGLTKLANAAKPGTGVFATLAAKSRTLASEMPRVERAALSVYRTFQAGFVDGSGGVGGATSTLKALINVFKPLVPSLRQVRTYARNLGETLGFLSAHGTTVTRVVRALVGAIIAVKVAQFGWNKTLAIGKALQKAFAVWTKISTGYTALQGAVATATEAKMIAMGGAIEGVTLAQKLSMAATKAWTAAQWLLNAAMDANPVGLVILAVAGLVTLAIELYKHFKPFHDLVVDTWNALREVFSLENADKGYKAKTSSKKTATTNTVTGYKLNSVAGAKASGGPVNAGSLYQVNEENGRAREFFHTSMAGRVETIPLSRNDSGGNSDDANGARIDNHLYIDGRAVTSAVRRNVRLIAARK